MAPASSALCARPATRTLPIILVTGKADLADRVEGLSAGADDYLTKPVELDELEARVAAQLRSHAAWSEAFEHEAGQRRAVTAALRRVRIDGSSEYVSAALVAELMPVLQLDALGFVRLSPNGSATGLAMGGSWAGRYRLKVALRQHLARQAEHRYARPWSLESGPLGEGEARDGGVMVIQAMPGSADGSGLLALGLPSGHDSAIDTARRLPLFMEVAALAATLLQPGIEAGQARLLARAALEAIIEAQAFSPHFQPVLSLADGAVVGYEALTRFDDGVAPDVRFGEALRLELGEALERATLGAAVEAARSLPPGAFLALNVSPSFALDAQLSVLLRDAQRQIVLEITEHAPIEDYGVLGAALSRIPRIQLAIDDAGSGYASLRHILALRPAYVKLDTSWVRDIDADPARQALVAGLAHFAEEIGCQLIGEGIESEAERSALLRLGVGLGQGYLLGYPAPQRPAGESAT